MVEKAFNIIIKHGVEGEGKRAFEAASHLFDESSSSRAELVRRMDLKVEGKLFPNKSFKRTSPVDEEGEQLSLHAHQR